MDEQPDDATPTLRKLARKPATLGAMDLFASLDMGGSGSAVGHPQRIEAVLAQIRDGLAGALSTESTVHGHQVDLMFEGLVAALGSCLLIKQEDAGSCYFTGQQLKLPDYRITTAEGVTLLVEVKSHGKDSLSECRLSKGEMDGLQRYARLAGGTVLRVAVYWVEANFWTLVDPRFFKRESGKYVLSITDALMHNEMVALGDVLVATRPPLSLTIYADPARERSIDQHHEAHFTIGGFELRCAGVLLEDGVEQSLAFFFMLNSPWAGSQHAHVEEGNVVSVTFEMAPDEPVEGQYHQLLGPLSSMFSTWFRFVTMEGPDIQRMGMTVDPGSLGQLIPTDYDSEALPLWRFHVQPKHHRD